MWTFHSNFERSGWIFSSYVFFHLKKWRNMCRKFTKNKSTIGWNFVKEFWTSDILGDFVAIVHFCYYFSYKNDIALSINTISLIWLINHWKYLFWNYISVITWNRNILQNIEFSIKYYFAFVMLESLLLFYRSLNVLTF